MNLKNKAKAKRDIEQSSMQTDSRLQSEASPRSNSNNDRTLDVSNLNSILNPNPNSLKIAFGAGKGKKIILNQKQLPKKDDDLNKTGDFEKTKR